MRWKRFSLRTVIVLVLFFALQLLYGNDFYSKEGKAWSLRLEGSMALLNGEVNEIVYPSFSTVNSYLSQLSWELKNTPILNLKIIGRFARRFEIGATAGFALSEGSGSMNDYDWYYSNITDWTHHSYHDIYLDNSFLGDFYFRYHIVRRRHWGLSAGTGLKIIHWDWSDAVRYLEYTTGINAGDTYEDGDPLHNLYLSYDGDQGISYLVTYYMPFLSVSGFARFFRTEIELGFQYSPLTIADAWDYHHQRNYKFNDSGIGGQMLALQLSVRFRINDDIYVGLSGDLQYLFEMTGDSDVYYIHSGDYLGTSQNSAGFQFLLYSFALSIGTLF